MDAKRRDELEIFLSSGRRRASLGGLSPSTTAFDVAREENEEKSDGEKMGGWETVRKRCRAMLE